MEQVTIHKAQLGDLPVVQQIARETFLETFAEANTDEDMRKYLTENFSDIKVSAELCDPDSEFTLLGKVGHLSAI